MTDDCVRGILLGLAAGDRIGGPTTMAVLLAESLGALGRFDSEDVQRRYLEWWQAGGFDTGPVADRVFRLMAAGERGPDAVTQVHQELHGRTAGCNPAHRAAPLAMAAFLTDEDLPAVAVREAALTHFDVLAGDVSAAVVVLCRSLAQGTGWQAARERAAEGRAAAVRTALLDPNDHPLSFGGFAPEVLRAAISFLDRQPILEDALDASVRFAAPANYCPVLVGSIGGAWWGASAIPAAMVAHCGILPRVITAANALALYPAAKWVPD